MTEEQVPLEAPTAPPPLVEEPPPDSWRLVRIAAAVYGAIVLFALGYAFLKDDLHAVFGEG